MILFLLELKQLNVLIQYKAGKLLVKGNKSALTTDIKKRLGANKAAILQLYEDLGLACNSQLAPVTQSQERLWFLSQMEGDSAAFNMPGQALLRGDLNVQALCDTFNTIVQRHDSLRTTFVVDDDGKAHQLINPYVKFDIDVVDVSKDQSQQLMREEANKPFDLAQDSMLRVKLLRIKNDEFILMYTLHHIISDGWSIGVLMSEIGQLYASYCQNHGNSLPELAIQFSDYAHWERRRMDAGEYAPQLEYWQQQLKALPVVHNLPLDHPRPAEQSHKGKVFGNRIDKALIDAFSKVCRAQGTTLFMGFNAAFSLLLSRYSGVKDIVMGTSIANREHPDVEPLIGFFLNTLVLRTDVSKAADFNGLLAHSKDVVLGAFTHQQLPFESLIQTLELTPTLSHSPLFQVMLILQNTDTSDAQLPGLTFTPVSSG
ncbi:MAG: condensation domain-containing protein, partial [Psychrosphaera sp.]|nr:condensation domain-containing protein [Psychrosphaera sp.]